MNTFLSNSGRKTAIIKNIITLLTAIGCCKFKIPPDAIPIPINTMKKEINEINNFLKAHFKDIKKYLITK